MQPVSPLERKQLALDVGAFLVTIVLAVLQRWTATDLIWGLWLSSLALGYAFIVTAIAGALRYSTLTASGAFQEIPAGMRAVTAVPMALFLLFFFTIHFGGFHFVHGFFLCMFFPFHDLPFKGGDAEFIFNILPEVVARTWPFVLAGAVSRLSDYRDAFRVRESDTGKLMFKPYVNVIRMHLLIFVFFFAHLAGLQSFLLYVILAAYFLPVGRLWKGAFFPQ